MKVVGQGQTLRKRGRPRKYPLSPGASPSSSSNNIISTNNNLDNNSNKYHSTSTLNNNNVAHESDEVKVHHVRTEGEVINKHLTRLMEILHELEISPVEKRVGVFERAPLFSMYCFQILQYNIL